MRDFSWKIIPWYVLLFEKTKQLSQLKQLSILDIENYRFILNTCHETVNCAETRVGFPVIFSRLPIEPKFSQVFYFMYKLWYTKCGNTVYRKCPMALNERGHFQTKNLNTRKFKQEAFHRHLKRTQFYATRVFFLSLFLATSMTNWTKTYTGSPFIELLSTKICFA